MDDSKAKTEAPAARPQDWADGTQRLRKEEDALLKAGGFEPWGTDLWAKGGVCYGRKAALQDAAKG